MASVGMQQGQVLSLQQVLAPQLQQSLQILQAPTLELRSLVQQELEVNPVLEELPSEPAADEFATPNESSETVAADDFDREFAELARIDDEWRDHFAQNQSYNSRSSEDEERRQFFFDSITTQTTLQQHLLDQLRLHDLSPGDFKLGELIIGNIDDDGYLQSTTEEMALNTGTAPEDLSRLLDLIQTFHPSGVGAHDLRESLLIQLRLAERTRSLEYQIVDQCMELLGKRKFPEIARKLGSTPSLVQHAANAIARLDPKPGRIFAPPNHIYVLPDVSVEKINDQWIALLEGEQIPHLRISNTYKDLMAQGAQGGGVKDYIREKIRSGKFLIRSIHQRQQTIQNIANEILKRQSDFFENGPSFLKPMTMQQVAAAVGIHETTVSRAVSGKYMATPHGLFEMKYFFTAGYETADGESFSNTSVKDAIAALIRQEDTTNPLSDKEIVTILSDQGIPIARRTVAKYRMELNILPSNLRKHY